DLPPRRDGPGQREAVALADDRRLSVVEPAVGELDTVGAAGGPGLGAVVPGPDGEGGAAGAVERGRGPEHLEGGTEGGGRRRLPQGLQAPGQEGPQGPAVAVQRVGQPGNKPSEEPHARPSLDGSIHPPPSPRGRGVGGEGVGASAPSCGPSPP